MLSVLLMKENKIDRKNQHKETICPGTFLDKVGTGVVCTYLALILVQLPSMEEKDNSKYSYHVAGNVNSIWGVKGEDVGYTTHSFSRNHLLHSLE